MWATHKILSLYTNTEIQHFFFFCGEGQPRKTFQIQSDSAFGKCITQSLWKPSRASSRVSIFYFIFFFRELYTTEKGTWYACLPNAEMSEWILLSTLDASMPCRCCCYFLFTHIHSDKRSCQLKIHNQLCSASDQQEKEVASHIACNFFSGWSIYYKR